MKKRHTRTRRPISGYPPLCGCLLGTLLLAFLVACGSSPSENEDDGGGGGGEGGQTVPEGTLTILYTVDVMKRMYYKAETSAFRSSSLA